MPRNSILSRLNDTSKMGAVNTSSYTLMYLDTDSLVPSKDNFYGIREIEALADNMLTAGNIEPVIVGKVDGEFRIISGHRRWHAAVKNKERGCHDFDDIACMVKEMSYNMFMFTLISANAFTRRLNDYELIRQAEQLREYTTRLCNEEGLEIHGRMRDYLASTLGVSNTKMAQIDSINKNLSDEGKKALKSGEMNFSKAYQASRLPEEKQHEVIVDKELLSNDVKDMARKLTEEASPQPKESCDKVPYAPAYSSMDEPKPHADMDDKEKQRLLKDKEPEFIEAFYKSLYPSERETVKSRKAAKITKMFKEEHGQSYDGDRNDDGILWNCFPDKINFSISGLGLPYQITWGQFTTKLLNYLEEHPELETWEPEPEPCENNEEEKQEEAEAQPNPEEYTCHDVKVILKREKGYLKDGRKADAPAKFIRKEKILVDALTLLLESM